MNQELVMQMNFEAFISEHAKQHQLPNSLIEVVKSILFACCQISDKVRLGFLSDILGEADTTNIQGETQKKLDIVANRLLIDCLSSNPYIAGLASEEEEDFIAINEQQEYLVLFDPLDGSSNIEVDISIGTIFSILKKPQGPLTEQAFLQAGRQQLAAGYVLYGPQTILVLTFAYGVYLFTLNQEHQFILQQQKIRIPQSTAEFAINMSNQRHWEVPMQEYITELLLGSEGKRAKNFNMRWVASMVAEVHRILIRGGIFLYPKDDRQPFKMGKLRLMYEANPMSFIVEQAQGKASNIEQAILEIAPEQLHQRVAVILGSTEEVNKVIQKHNMKSKG